MKLSYENIKNLSNSNKIAITIDTSIFDRYKLNLLGKPLSIVSQLKKLDIKFILSDVVVHEIKNHLNAEIVKSKKHLKEIVFEVNKNFNFDLKSIDDVNTILNAQPKQIAENRLNEFITLTEVIIEQAKNHNIIEKLFDKYFNLIPPFSNNDKKKNEFPDAAALLTIESWAEKNKTFVLCVSSDGDWENYCKDSEKLIFINNLPDALFLLQKELKSKAFPEFIESNFNELLFSLINAVNEQSYKIQYQIEASSQFEFDEEYIDAYYELTPQANKFDQSAIDIIQQSEDSIDVKIKFVVDTEIKVNYTFKKWDSIDREYISMGSATITHKETLKLEAILSYVVDDNNYSIYEIDILNSSVPLDLGDIEPDWMSEDHSKS